MCIYDNTIVLHNQPRLLGEEHSVHLKVNLARVNLKCLTTNVPRKIIGKSQHHLTAREHTKYELFLAKKLKISFLRINNDTDGRTNGQ